MKKKVLLALVFTLSFIMLVSSKVTAAPQSAKGFHPADGMYVKAEPDYYWEGRYSDGRNFSEYIAS